MMRRFVVVPLLALAVDGSVPAHAAIRYRHMSILAAAQLCQQARVARQYRIAVAGFFRPGPENHGPDIVGGALFDSDTVPKDAALHIARHHGIPFGVDVGWKFAGSIDGITRPHARMSVQGVLYCAPGSAPFLKPTAIAVSKLLASSPLVTPGPTRLDVTERSFDSTQAHVTVSSRGLLNQVVADLNALPLYPRHGPISCPADFGSWYVLSFHYRAGSEETVTVAPRGCEGITRHGQRARWMLTLKHPAILAVLQRIVIEGETADSMQTHAHILTVKQLRALCSHGTGAHPVRVHGYYAADTFFGPGPPATPVTYQTGYLFGQKVQTPIDPSIASAGVLVLGPSYGVGPSLPSAGWVQISGRWSCTTFRLRLASWRPWAHSGGS